jgi:hypothetical protein
MIKHINHQNVSTTPFVAAKARALSNIQNADTVILEPNAYPNGTNISLDYVDYNSGDPVINRECDIALEQQGLDSLGYEEGITGSAIFNSASAQNTDGTYKSLVHRQTRNAFYNTYHNPTEIFGVEHIDFPLSKTLRNLSSEFRMFTIPRLVFGDKIQPQSLKFYDTLLDDNVAIFDDGYQNLIAGYNLFSKVQEVRTFPSMSQLIITGSATASYYCPTYQNKIFPTSVTESAFLFLGGSTGSGSFSQGHLLDVPLTDSGSQLLISFLSGSIHNTASADYPSITFGFAYGSILNYVSYEYASVPHFVSFLSGSYNLTSISMSTIGESGSITSTFLSGSLRDNIIYITGSNDSSSVNTTFLSGSLFDVILIAPTGNDSGSVTLVSFLSGSKFDQVVTFPLQWYDTASVVIGFNSGSLIG